MDAERTRLRRWLLRAAAASLLAATAGLLVNLIGRLHYTAIDNDHPRLLDDEPRSVSEREFWAAALREPEEPASTYVERLSGLISDRMLLIDSRYTRPTFFENWMLWFVARRQGHFEWIDTERAVRLGGGFCSQHAIVLNNLLRAQGIESRILELGGHVLNEVKVDRHWQAVDPDYDVLFGASLRELERFPERVYRAYRAAGRPDEEARHWQEVFASHDDNWHFPSSSAFAPRSHWIERAALFVVWILPGTALFVGTALLAASRLLAPATERSSWDRRRTASREVSRADEPARS